MNALVHKKEREILQNVEAQLVLRFEDEPLWKFCELVEVLFESHPLLDDRLSRSISDTVDFIWTFGRLSVQLHPDGTPLVSTRLSVLRKDGTVRCLNIHAPATPDLLAMLYRLNMVRSFLLPEYINVLLISTAPDTIQRNSGI